MNGLGALRLYKGIGMPPISEIVLSIVLGMISLTVIIITFIVIKSRRGSPLTLQIKGFGVEFSLIPSEVEKQTGVKHEK